MSVACANALQMGLMEGGYEGFEGYEGEYYDGKGEEAQVSGATDFSWQEDTYICRCDGECNCDEDVAEQMAWLSGMMRKLENEIIAAEGRCRRWAAARGVSDDALKDVYSYLLEDMANE